MLIGRVGWCHVYAMSDYLIMPGELFKNNIMNARSERSDLLRLVVEYLIARYFERWGASITRTKLMKLLAAALFINPDTKEIDIHELAHCFKYGIYKYSVYSPVVNEVIKELDREAVSPLGLGIGLMLMCMCWFS